MQIIEIAKIKINIFELVNSIEYFAKTLFLSFHHIQDELEPQMEPELMSQLKSQEKNQRIVNTHA